ncbi:contractile injection system protein, VgrG/Pvc8 family [Chitinolyticbacter albus]|uniref:contractile injection system protein, VgrG/Pvc8 family n=1 Tax=Chitinolyticbacter albus TaxID=2961951 RepID=UPI00210AF1D3|nr:contractile injection system protein, VgrG/Pvc8 family [Chitinolyticbacter albus]
MNDRVVPGIAERIGGMKVSPSDPQGLYLHAALFLPGRIVSDETFRLASFSGQESVSEPFEFQLELHANTEATTQQPMRFTDLIGRPVTVGIQYPGVAGKITPPDDFANAVNARNSNRGNVAYFNGIVTAFAMEDQGVYRATMKPALYKLTLTNRYQIYAHKSVREVVEELMRRHRVAYSVEAIKGQDASGRENLAECRVQDWMQAGESDYELLRRLMGKAHIYYYMRHDPTGHTVVFANRPDYPQVYADRRALRYTASLTDELGQHQPDTVVQYNYQMSLQASGVTGSAVRQEAAWERDAVAVPTDYHYQPLADSGELPFHQYKIYQYGYSSNELQEYAENTQLALETATSQLSGGSTCAFFHVGHQFALSNQPWGPDANPDPVRPSLSGQSFVLTSVKHEASLDGSYTNQFQACAAAGLITPFSLADTQQGAVLAVVVPPPPPPDWRYYDKNVYNPQNAQLLDTRGDQSKLDAKGIYVRFTTEENAPTVWVKLASHMQTVPEYGVTVTVSRAQDESELPEVQSIVQSNGTKVIMPSTWTASSHTGNSYSTSYGDGKRISYGINSKYDLPAAINIVTAAYERGVFKDAGYSQGAGYSYSTSETRETGILSESWSYGCGYSNSWAKENKSFSATGRTYSESIRGKSDPALQSSESSYPDAAGAVEASIGKTYGNTYSNSTMYGNAKSQNQMFGNSDSLSLTVGNRSSAELHVGNAINAAIMTGINSSNTLHNIDQSLSVQAMDARISAVGITTSVGMTGMANRTDITGMSTSDSVTGMNIGSSMVGMSQSTNVVGMSMGTDVTGMAMSQSLTGMRMSNSTTGMVLDNSTLGMSLSSSVTGMTISDSTVGLSLQTSTAGISTTINNSGISNSFEFTGGGIQYSNRPAKPEMETKSVTINIMVGVKIYL